MPLLIRRVSAVILAVGLLAGKAAVCDGWLPMPEARMACCTEGGACPMHRGESRGTGSDGPISQAQADLCCAASERKESSQPIPTLVAPITAAVLDPAIVLTASVPPLVLTDGWRTTVPIPTTPVPKHILLSVFIV